MPDLIAALDNSEFVTVHASAPEDFFDWESFLDLFYSDFRKKVKQNHIFKCSYEKNRKKNQLQVELRESNLDKHKTSYHNAIKMGFHGRSKYDAKKGLPDAVNNRPQDIRGYQAELLKQIEPPGINIYKQVELAFKYAPNVPEDKRSNELFIPPPQEVVDAVTMEGKMRKELRGQLNAEKKKVQKELKRKIEAVANQE